MELPDFNLGTWQQRYNQGFIGATVGYFDQAPITPVIVPYLFTQQYVRVLITADYTKPRWNQGCLVFQTIDTFLGDNDVIRKGIAPLGKAEIFDFTQYPDGYNLRLEFFPWFKDVNVLIYTWQG